MKCLVCGKTQEGLTCPVCGFPVPEFLGNPEEGLKRLQPVIRSWRGNFLKKVEVGILLHHYTVEDDATLHESTSEMLFGKMSDFAEKEVRLNQIFDWLSEEERLEVDVFMTVREKNIREEKCIRVPNIRGAKSLEVGCEGGEDLGMCLKVWSDNGKSRESAPFYWFE